MFVGVFGTIALVIVMIVLLIGGEHEANEQVRTLKPLIKLLAYAGVALSIVGLIAGSQLLIWLGLILIVRNVIQLGWARLRGVQ